MKTLSLASALAVTLSLSVGPAFAFAAQLTGGVEDGLILASGEVIEAQRPVSATVPPQARAAWQRFGDVRGVSWRGWFDGGTGVPGRVWGAGLPAPGAMQDAEVAAAHARAILDAHLDLFAPGARSSELVLVTNHSDGDLRTLGFVQTRGGLRVYGGQVSFRYKKDRLIMIGSEALPDVKPIGAALPWSDDAAMAAAERWIHAAISPKSARVEAVKGALVLPLRDGFDIEYRTVIDVRVRTTRPAGFYAVYLDAATLEPVARRQLAKFTTGQLSFNVPVRWPGGMRVDRPVRALQVGVDGTTPVTDISGMVNWAASDPIAIQVGVVGPETRVINDAGATTSTTVMLAPNGTFVWNHSANELADAQLTSFVATNDVKDYVRKYAPNLTWLDEQIPVTVNIDDVCNAYSDGDTTNFFRAGQGCGNTGRLPDVVAHEFGHAVHFHSILEGVGSWDTSLSEGISDYLAATMQNDPQMGRGFFGTNAPLRDIDPTDGEMVWPTHISRDPHVTGEIIGGALWDLRKAMIIELGEARGISFADRAWLAIIQRAGDIPSTYAETLALDDDDGNLENGTPHLCLINAAFGRHGLVDKVNAGPGIGAPRHPATGDLAVSFPFAAHDTCPGSNVTSARIQWIERDNPGQMGTVEMALAPQGGSYAGMLPTPARPAVLQYRIDITFDDGSTIGFPDNPADPLYEAFVGEVIPLYCTDFEIDPLSTGWGHALEAVGQTNTPPTMDDWQWGAIETIPGSSDPARPYSGLAVVGNDLGQRVGNRVDGRYLSSATTALTSPAIDVQGHTQVRLQYRRWLTVEDGLNDKAIIWGNGNALWQNKASERAADPRLQSLLPHLDKEWRFQDVDLSGSIVDGQVSVKFQLEANRRRSYGGWTLDDFCVVAVAVCGNGKTEGAEQCDDGNGASGDGCSSACAPDEVIPVCGNGAIEAGEQCDDGVNDGTACTQACTTPVPAARCGDGRVDSGEACDDGTNDGTACTATCTVPVTMPTPLPEEPESCGCRTASPSSSAGLLALLAVMWVASRRRPAR